MRINQVSNNNQINPSLPIEKDQAIQNKVKSIVSQLPGKIRNISYKYNDQSISKAKITIVVSSKEEAEKVRQSIDKEVDIKVIIREEVKNEEQPTSDDSIKVLENNTIKEDQDMNEQSANIYSYNRGPDGKIYGIIKKEKDNSADAFKNISVDNNINNSLQDKYINIYKRYNFKNIITKDSQRNNRFSLNI